MSSATKPLREREMIYESKLLLIDINVLGIGSMHQWAYKDRSFKGKPTGAIQGTLEKLIQLIAEYKDHVPIVLWDDRCHWREKILPSYKRHRWESPEQQAFLKCYLAQAEIVRQLVGHLGMAQIFCPGFEADDLAGVICRNIDQDWSVVLATSDSDWYQALRKNVIWLSPLTGRKVTLADLSDPSVIRDGPFDSTDHYIQAKALAGDSSDGIPGVHGVGIKTAARIIREHGSLEALWAKHDDGVPVIGIIQLRVVGGEYREIYFQNLQLVDWRLAPSLPTNYEFVLDAVNKKAFEATCVAWGLSSAIQNLKVKSMPEDRVVNVGIEIRQILVGATSEHHASKN